MGGEDGRLGGKGGGGTWVWSWRSRCRVCKQITFVSEGKMKEIEICYSKLEKSVKDKINKDLYWTFYTTLLILQLYLRQILDAGARV